MGAQIAELAAMQAIDRTSALVLITPTPLQGNVLPDEVRAMLRESGGNPEAQKQIRKAFSTHLPHEAMDLDPSIIMGPETVRGYYDAFTTGDPVGAAPSTYTGPTLLIGAEQDPVIPVEMVRQIRDERFPGAELALINESGHWPQVEQPGQLGRHLAEFLRRRQN
jgi:pimeloyl-ACP methyl ester carboxylesterase